MYGKIESIRFAGIDWQAILKMLPQMALGNGNRNVHTIYIYNIYT